jgi:hypothetical protein
MSTVPREHAATREPAMYSLKQPPGWTERRQKAGTVLLYQGAKGSVLRGGRLPQRDICWCRREKRLWVTQYAEGGTHGGRR